MTTDIEHGPPGYDSKTVDVAEEKAGPHDNEKHDRRRSSVVSHEVLTGEIYDSRFESTHRGLKSRHAQMIALGGTIGTALFVSTGQTLARGGPAFILACYTFMSLLIWCIVTGITEVAAWLPTRGCSMNMFGYRYGSRSLGFSMGWLYWYSLGILVPYEITAAGLVIDYWSPPVNIAVWISIMIVVVVGLNALPVKFYGETEFWFAGLKVIMMMGLLILSFILFWGGGPHQHGILGFRYWNHPGAANTYLESGDAGRFCALLSTLLLSAFAFTFAPELLVATGGEMESPRRNLPTAARRYFYRIIFFYIGSIIAITVISPSDSPRLTSGGSGAGASPFVVGIKNAGIGGLDSVINAGIIISAWSSGNSFLFLSSRSLYSLALSGNAPKFFKACTKSGVPYRAVAASSLFTFLAYLNVASSSAVVFNWFVNLTNTSGFISWICCAIVSLRFMKACKAQGIPKDALPYHNKWFQPWGSYFAIAGFTFLLLMNGFDVFWPSNWSASSFLTAYIGIPLFLVFYVGHRIYAWNDPWFHRPEEVDLQTGIEEVEANETPAPVYDKWWKHFRVIFE